MLTLNTLSTNKHKKHRRVGRGHGSGRGIFSGRGIKGQRARTGGRGGLKLRELRRIFQGIPKVRGFKSDRSRPAVISLGTITERYPKQTKIRLHGYKVLAGGTVPTGVTIVAEAFSAAAKKEIIKAGGKTITCGKHF